MIVQCQQCSTKFRLDDGRVTEQGVKVRCSRCRHVFVVRKEAGEVEPETPVAVPIVEPEAPVVAVPAPVAVEPEEEFVFEEPPLSSSAPSHEDFAFEDAPPAAAAPTEEFSFGDVPTPEAEEAKPLFEVNYPPPSNDDDDFDFSDFEFHADEVKPIAAQPEPAKEEDDFDFGVFIESGAEEKGKDDFEVLPERKPDDYAAVVSAASAAAPSAEQVAASVSPQAQEPVAEDFVIQGRGEDREAKVETAAAVEAGEEGPKEGAAVEELPPFVVSRRQSSSFFPVVVTAVAVVFVLVMAAAGVYFLKEGPEGFNRLGLGFMAKWFGVEPKEEGRIVLRNIEGSFMKNAEAGEVFVIKGEAVNEYKKPRASIQVKGIIFGKGGAEIASKTIYCGNSMSPELIGALPISKIESTMNNQFGDSLSNLGVAPGKAIPFVIVLTNVSAEGVDYGVEVAGSTVASKQ